jgi:hypothetical protein
LKKKWYLSSGMPTRLLTRSWKSQFHCWATEKLSTMSWNTAIRWKGLMVQKSLQKTGNMRNMRRST